jgi:hypothetical protein
VSVPPSLNTELIRRELTRHERSQAWLGRKVGVKDPALFHHYLHGHRRRPDGLVQRIAAVLELPEDELLEEPTAA